MRRATLEKWLGEPFFERTLVGALVRVAIKRAYILAEVIQAQEREPGTYRRAPPPAAISTPALTLLCGSFPPAACSVPPARAHVLCKALRHGVASPPDGVC